MCDCAQVFRICMNSWLIQYLPKELHTLLGEFRFLIESHSFLSQSCQHKRYWSCSVWDTPNTNISSMYYKTSSRPSGICDVLFWKCSGAEAIPKQNVLKQNLSKGLIKVVRRAEFCDKGIWRKPELASTLAPRESSPEGRMYRSLFTALLSFVKSTHMRAVPLGFRTTTTPEHQSVGWFFYSGNHTLALHAFQILFHFWH